MILCCGEALIDMLPSQTAEGKAAYAPHTGGAVFNTAIALGRLGISAGLLTGLSTDLHGELLAADLAASGVDTSLAIRSGRPTTLAFVILENGHASYTFYDENSAGRMITPDDLPDIPAGVEAMFFGGISLAVDPGAETFAALAEREKGKRPIMIDPNIRPGFISDEARYHARLERMFAAADIIKVSDEDLAWLAPGHATTSARVEGIKGPRIKIVTEGARGATAFLPDGEPIQVPAIAAKVADTVGAGDTFNAGLLASMALSGALQELAQGEINRARVASALRYAHRVAAITVSREGADPPWRQEVGEPG